MIGIIDNQIRAYSILEKIRKKYPNTDVYFYIDSYSNVRDVISLFLEKGCRIFILPSEEKKMIENEYPNCFFFSVPITSSFLDRGDLIQAIMDGNLKRIEEILSSLSVPVSENIVLNRVELLFIKNLIAKYFSNMITDVFDQLILDMDRVILEEELSMDGEGISNIIRFKE